MSDSKTNSGDINKPVEDIQEGDFVDLESSPYKVHRNHEYAPFEYFEVIEVEKRGNTTCIGFEGIGLLWEYQNGSTLIVKD